MTDHPHGDYPIGYKKPPRHSQFKLGQSGNRRGRPRELITVATVIAEELQSSVIITEHEKRIKHNKLSVIVKQAINKAMAGNFRPIKSLMNLLATLEQLNQTPTKKRPKRPLLEGIDLRSLSEKELGDLYRKTIASGGERS